MNNDLKIPDAIKAIKSLNAEAMNGQLQELEKAGLTPELKTKISSRFIELALKNPKWKISKALRKAGEYYHVKFTFD